LDQIKESERCKKGMSLLSITMSSMIKEKMIKKTYTYLTVLWFKLELVKNNMAAY